MVLISHLMVAIEWVPYPQKECGYCRMTLKSEIEDFHSSTTHVFTLSPTKKKLKISRVGLHSLRGSLSPHVKGKY
jgi:hypothetical protein